MHFRQLLTAVSITLLLFQTHTNAQNLEDLGKQKPVRISGSIGSSYTTISTTDTGRVPMPAFWNVAANLNIDLYRFSIPLTAIVTNSNINFTHSFNQFGISPRYKWITLHAGYRQFNYSNFSVSGQTFLGGGIDLNPGKFRFGVFYGRNRKSTPLDTALFPQKIPGSYPLDVTTINGVNRYSQQGNFERWGWGGRIGYGTQTNFVDLILFKGQDRESSIADTFSKARLTPEENLVIGLNTFQQIGKHISLGFNGGASFYTYNVTADTVPADVDIPLKSTIGKLMTLRTTTQLQWAGDVSAGIHFTNFSLNAQYRHIEPYYRSMGIATFLSDLQSISVQPSWSMLKQKLRFTNSVQLQKDNLNQYKQYTTRRTILNSSVSINPSTQFGLDLSYGNYGMTQQRANKTVDSIKIFQQSNTYTAAPRYLIYNNRFTNAITVIGSYTEMNGGGQLKGDSNRIQNLYATLTNTFSLAKSGWSMNAGGNYNSAVTIFNKLVSYGAILGISKSFFSNTFSLSNNNTFLWNSLDGKPNGNTYSVDVNLNYQAFKHHTISSSFNYLYSPANGIYNLQDFRQTRTTLTYQYRF